jgi:hypothetical protein
MIGPLIFPKFTRASRKKWLSFEVAHSRYAARSQASVSLSAVAISPCLVSFASVHANHQARRKGNASSGKKNQKMQYSREPRGRGALAPASAGVSRGTRPDAAHIRYLRVGAKQRTSSCTNRHPHGDQPGVHYSLRPLPTSTP